MQFAAEVPHLIFPSRQVHAWAIMMKSCVRSALGPGFNLVWVDTQKWLAAKGRWLPQILLLSTEASDQIVIPEEQRHTTPLGMVCVLTGDLN